ncbi:hypothetical protein FRX31_028015 [Thalictrum thalictroides]|uniref:Uncharacterized protein n=1 Tax=Thalictrum thalictroides TaxID=46969 RepID=A0A7J6VCR7_THATH|nr:hypothetical protein FRX31_028015 [Thalictrum thalictroides]
MEEETSNQGNPNLKKVTSNDIQTQNLAHNQTQLNWPYEQENQAHNQSQSNWPHQQAAHHNQAQNLNVDNQFTHVMGTNEMNNKITQMWATVQKLDKTETNVFQLGPMFTIETQITDLIRSSYLYQPHLLPLPSIKIIEIPNPPLKIHNNASEINQMRRKTKITTGKIRQSTTNKGKTTITHYNEDSKQQKKRKLIEISSNLNTHELPILNNVITHSSNNFVPDPHYLQLAFQLLSGPSVPTHLLAGGELSTNIIQFMPRRNEHQNIQMQQLPHSSYTTLEDAAAHSNVNTFLQLGLNQNDVAPIQIS